VGGLGCDGGSAAANANPATAKAPANRIATTIQSRTAETAERGSRTKVPAGAWEAVIIPMTRAGREFFRSCYVVFWPLEMAPRQAPVSAPRPSISSLKRWRSPRTRRVSSPAAEPKASAGPSA